MKKIFAIILTLTLLGCAPEILTKPDSRISSLTENKSVDGKVGITYQSYMELFNNLINKSSTQLWTTEKTEQAKQALPIGGRVLIEITRITIGAADTKWFTVIVKDNNKEIVRETGQESIPYYIIDPVYNTTLWHNLMFVNLPQHSKQFSVFVVDELLNKRFDFVVNDTP